MKYINTNALMRGVKTGGTQVGAATAAVIYEESFVPYVVSRANLGAFTFPSVLLQPMAWASLVVGWAPLATAAMLSEGNPGGFWDAYGGATAYRRIDGVVKAVQASLEASGVR